MKRTANKYIRGLIMQVFMKSDEIKALFAQFEAAASKVEGVSSLISKQVFAPPER